MTVAHQVQNSVKGDPWDFQNNTSEVVGVELYRGCLLKAGQAISRVFQAVERLELGLDSILEIAL